MAKEKAKKTDVSSAASTLGKEGGKRAVQHERKLYPLPNVQKSHVRAETPGKGRNPDKFLGRF
jgi:hypothetical protein